VSGCPFHGPHGAKDCPGCLEHEAHTLATYERLPIESAMTREAMRHLQRALFNYVQGGLPGDKRIAMELRNLANLLAAFLERADGRVRIAESDDPLLG